MADVALRNLDVLDLCGVSRVPFSAAWEHVGERPLKTGAAAIKWAGNDYATTTVLLKM